MKSFIFLVIVACGLTVKAQDNGIKNDPTVYMSVEQMPEFPGGIPALKMFIDENTRMPEKKREDRAFRGGKTFLRVVIDTSGKVIDPVIIKGCSGCAECDKEAMRVASAMPLWIPGKQNGRKLKVYYSIPFSFEKR